MRIVPTSFFTLLLCGIVLLGCKKEKAPTGELPSVTTIAVTDVQPDAATTGGKINSTGGDEIAYSGICWSKTNFNPTTSDDTLETKTSTGSFISVLTNLNSSSTYYVRAYAVNRYGTGYGNVISFVSGNAPPVATSVAIAGAAAANQTLTGNYTYSDEDNDAESGSSYTWYQADDASGTGESVIAGASERTYTILDSQQGKYIRFGVTPKAATGTLVGLEVKSVFIGAVGESTTVTFTYNGNVVTYGILVSTTTGKKWLDRNLGASRVAQSEADYQAYGDLFQWGRLADGHQLINRTGPANADATGVTGTTSLVEPWEYSSTDIPNTNKFIVVNGNAGDWRNPQNPNLWNGVSGVNNPCPPGWRVATDVEWLAEGFANLSDGYAKLKLTLTGFRKYATGTVENTEDYGFYWTSTPIVKRGANYTNSQFMNATSAGVSYTNRGYGYACRCIKD